MLPRTELLLAASPMTGSCHNHCWKQFCCTPGDGWWAEDGDQGSPNESADPGVTHVPQPALLQCCKQKMDELYNVLLLMLIFLSAGVWCFLGANRPLWPQNNIYSILAAGLLEAKDVSLLLEG